MLNYLRSTPQDKTVSDILAGFEDTVVRLDRLIANHGQRLAAIAEQSNALLDEGSELREEIKQAQTARDNILALIQ